MRNSLGSVVTRVRSIDPRSHLTEPEFLYVDIGAVDQNTKSIQAAKVVPITEAPSRARQLLESGDILVSTVRPNLNAVAVVPQSMGGSIGSTGFCVLRVDPAKADPSYIFHWVKSNAFIEDMVRKATGASYPAVSDRIILDSFVPLPPLEEQRRIAAILDQAEELRAQRRAAIALLDQLPQTIFLEMFGDPATNPKGWPVKMLGQICDVRDGTHDSPKYVSVHGYPLVTSKNVTQGHIDLSTALRISEEDFTQINKRSQVSRGDIIMPMIGTIGYPVLVTEEPKFAIKNLALIKFQHDSPHNTYIHQLLSSPYFNFVTASRNRGGTQKFVSLGDLRSLPTPVPPESLQQKFATRIAAISRAKSSHKAALVLIQALLSSLQHQVFEGSPRVAKELSHV